MRQYHFLSLLLSVLTCNPESQICGTVALSWMSKHCVTPISDFLSWGFHNPPSLTSETTDWQICTQSCLHLTYFTLRKAPTVVQAQICMVQAKKSGTQASSVPSPSPVSESCDTTTCWRHYPLWLLGLVAVLSLSEKTHHILTTTAAIS